MSVNVNTASAQELRQAFARIGDIVTHQILDFRQKYGVVKREAVNLALRGNLPTQILDLMDFSEPYDDPFDLNLLPPVPKANSREPLRSSSKTQIYLYLRSLKWHQLKVTLPGYQKHHKI